MFERRAAHSKYSIPGKKNSGDIFFIFITMKFVRNLILVLALSLPGYALAEADSVYTPEEKPSSYKPMFFGLEIGAGSVFVAGLEWGFPSFLIYEQKRPDGVEELWTPNYGIVWTVRTRYFYDSIEEDHGLLLNPNIQYLRFFIGLALGPQVGWFSSAGFDYGASVRLNLFFIADLEVGYLVNKEAPYVNVMFTLSLPRFGLFDP